MAAAVEASEALFIDDNELARLATDIPDLRVRLGIGDTIVFGGQGFSLVKVQMQASTGCLPACWGWGFEEEETGWGRGVGEGGEGGGWGWEWWWWWWWGGSQVLCVPGYECQ